MFLVESQILLLFSFKFVHDLNDYFRLIHGGSFLNKNSYYLLNDGTASIEGEVQGINQFQYYGGLSLNPGAGFNILGGIHLLHYSFPFEFPDAGRCRRWIFSVVKKIVKMKK